MAVEHAVFLRIDTADGSPYLDGTAGELIVSALLAARDKGWFDLLGFVVLPNEVQLLFVPRNLPVSILIGSLETSVYPTVCQTKSINHPVFDPDFYREKIDSNEDIKHRLQWMHLTPVRARLTRLSEAYPYSSANSRYQDTLNLAKTMM
jgi:hypothetical protein